MRSTGAAARGHSAPEQRVSVILPFRDAAATLGDAIDSIRKQTLTDFECLLIDHGSLDASSSIAADRSREDPRFRVVRARGSFVEALNLGVRESRSPLLARMDADDLAHERRLEEQVRMLLDDANLDLVSCLVDCFPKSTLGQGMKRYQDWINEVVTPDQIRNALFVESPIPHPSAVFRRSAFDRVGGYADTKGPEDYDLWLRMLANGAHARKVPAIRLQWRDGPQRLSRTDARYSKAQFFATKLRHFPLAVPPSTPLQIWGTGPTARKWARNLRQQGYEIRRFVDVIDSRVGRTVHGHTIQPVSAIRPGDGLVLAAVGLTGAREIIQANLDERGFRAGRDYLAVA